MNIITRAVSETDPYDQQAQILKLLTHPARLAILDILRDGEHCVCHMEAHLGYRQAYLSQQIAVLREAGLIQDRRDGWNIFYRVTDPRIYAILDAVQSVIGEKTASHRKEGVKCPCPHCKGSDSP
jgi:ArsR family transcriptional regulator